MSDEEDKKKVERSAEREKYWEEQKKKIDENYKDKSREGGRKFMHGVLEFFQGLDNVFEDIGQPQVEALEKQIKDIMGPWAEHLSNRDKAELITLTFEERTEKLIEYRKRYEKLGLSGIAEDTPAQISSDLETELVARARQAIDDVDSLFKYKSKVFADLEWEYKDDPKKLEEMKKIYEQIFLKIRHERGW